MRRLKFEVGNFYHIYNRGVEKRQIFQDLQDHYRFIHYLYEFNNINQVINLRTRTEKFQKIHSLNNTNKNTISSKFLVDILCFCLMPNHFHLLLKQRMENGVSNFMQKVGTGHTMYFNQKNKRTGRLFQGTFKAKLIDSDEYLLHLSRYIHLNPIDIIKHDWKEKGILNSEWSEIDKFLKKYRWSSYLDYIGIKNFPSVINKDFLGEQFLDYRQYKEFINSFVSDEKLSRLSLDT